MTNMLGRIETYYDTVPRRFARVEEVGPFTLFASEVAGWTYYGRPRLGGNDRFSVGDVRRLLARQRELGLPHTIEWVHETTPSLLDAVRDEGSLVLEEIPLMVLTDDLPPPTVVDGVTVRLLGVDDTADVASARAVANLAFAEQGTALGVAGPPQRNASIEAASPTVLDLLRSGDVTIAVAEDSDGALATGQHLPVAQVTELVGIATLPSARRQGLGAAVTAALVADARRRGVDTVFLTASSDDVARVYGRLGFMQVATGYAAEAGESA